MAYSNYDDMLEDDERVAPPDTFGERIGDAATSDDDMSDATNNDLTADPATGFGERLGTDESDDDFTRSLDPDENPHLADQLDDTNLQREAEDDYI